MKKFKCIVAISTMFLIGGLANVRAIEVYFSGYATSNEWRIVGAQYKTEDKALFTVFADGRGDLFDDLYFKAVSAGGDSICQVTLTEFTQATCSYRAGFKQEAGTWIQSQVLSKTYAPELYPISGWINYY